MRVFGKIGSQLLLAGGSLFINPSIVRLQGNVLENAFKLASGQSIRFRFRDLTIPKPGNKNYFRRTVHYPEKYTIKPIPTTNLAGRDPVTGRVVVGTLGGGVKHPYLWVDYVRKVPEGKSKLLEKVIEVKPEPNRSAHVALVGEANSLRYIIATENMKAGDLIVTSHEITRIAVRPNEGDAYPVGSLPVGLAVCCVETVPGRGGYFARGAGTSCTILRKIGERVILMIPSKVEVSIHQSCMAVVGKVSNAIHGSIHIGSANRLRELGYRPRSGLWQRKQGKHGRKIRPPPPTKVFASDMVEMKKPPPKIKLTLPQFPYHLP